MKPFTTGIFNQKLVPEPAASTQSVYHALDPVVQAVLTDRNANIPAAAGAGEQRRAGLIKQRKLDWLAPRTGGGQPASAPSRRRPGGCWVRST